MGNEVGALTWVKMQRCQPSWKVWQEQECSDLHSTSQFSWHAAELGVLLASV